METVSEYRMVTPSGRHIRMATKVTFANGREVRFTEKMGKREAIKQAVQLIMNKRCWQCGEGLPHLYDENCTNYGFASMQGGK